MIVLLIVRWRCRPLPRRRRARLHGDFGRESGEFPAEDRSPVAHGAVDCAAHHHRCHPCVRERRPLVSPLDITMTPAFSIDRSRASRVGCRRSTSCWGDGVETSRRGPSQECVPGGARSPSGRRRPGASRPHLTTARCGDLLGPRHLVRRAAQDRHVEGAARTGSRSDRTSAGASCASSGGKAGGTRGGSDCRPRSASAGPVVTPFVGTASR